MSLEEKVKESWNRNKGDAEAVVEEFKKLSNSEYDKVLELVEQLEKPNGGK